MTARFRNYIVLTGLTALSIVFLFISATFYTNQDVDLQFEPNSIPHGSPKSKDYYKHTKSISKWIVVTSVSLPTKQIAKLGQIPGWKLVVVADKKTPSSWSHPGVILLDVGTQSTLGYRIINHLPWNSYTRKMIGYLYAIENGAEVIYDTDDDNAPDNLVEFENNFEFRKTTRGLTLAGERDLVENPYAHFGQGSIWPRGYPLDLIGRPYNNSYTVCQMPTPLIQQGLVNGDPDVDAIFRLTRKNLYSSLNVEFDGFAPPVIFPRLLSAPFNSQNTIFHYNAFWALMLPISVSFRVTDIWRGYWAQPLLWKIGGFLGFYSPHTTQIRNAHNYLKDFGEEDQLYKQSGILVQQLKDWKCSSQNFYFCMINLTKAMAEWKMWPDVNVELVVAWIADLKRIGYRPPRRLLALIDPIASNLPCLNDSLQSYTVFHGVENSKTQRPGGRYALKKFCNLSLGDTPKLNIEGNNSAKQVYFPQHLLVVTFNHPHFENIWLLDLIYRPHFPNILYCGEIKNSSIEDNLPSTQVFKDANVKKFSIVHADVDRGYFAYECATRAIEMNYGVSGYVVLSDDVLLKFWNINKVNPEEMWLSYDYSPNFIETDDPFFMNSTAAVKWSWFKTTYGVTAVREAFKIINNPANFQSHPEFEQFSKNREKEGWNSSIAMYGPSDAFYLPSSKQDVFYQVSLIMRKCRVFLDIAVPVLTSGLASWQNVTVLPSIYIWYAPGARDKPFANFTEDISIIHPVKPSKVIQNTTLKMEYCSKYVQKVLSLP